MKTIIFNWKLNPQTFQLAQKLFSDYQKINSKLKNTFLVACPPFEYLWLLNQKRSGLALGAQDCFWEDLGAFTGSVSGLNLKTSGIDYVILGHSERRSYLGETDEIVNKKVLHAINSGLRPVLCLGEDLKTHQQGETAVNNFVKKQLKKNLSGFEVLSASQKNQLIVAYEPIWAISSHSGGVADNPENASRVIRLLKEILTKDFQIPSVKVIYGGSVSSKNIVSFLGYQEIDGFLPGRASLDVNEVQAMVEACEKTS